MLLHAMMETGGVQLYDAVLIDEAQDLPQPFFELVYRHLKEPKRIMWAYDELQNLRHLRDATSGGAVWQ